MQTTDAKTPAHIAAITFELVSLFVTTPICKDQASIKKILDLLLDGMDKTQLVADMHSCERAVTDMHFKKLILLSELVVATQPDG